MATYTIRVYDPSIDTYIGEFYYETYDHNYYPDKTSLTPITSITPPTYPGKIFDGCWVGDGKELLCIDEQGNFTEYFKNRVWANNGRVIVYWKDPISHKVTVDTNGGSDGTPIFYCRISDGKFFADELCTSQITSVTLPYRSRYSRRGLFASTVQDAVQYADYDGVLNDTLASVAKTRDVVVYAGWLANSMIILNRNGGSGGASVLYYDHVRGLYCDDEFTINTISSIETPSKNAFTFLGYFSLEFGGEIIVSSEGVVGDYSPSGSMTAFAQWEEIPVGGSYILSFDPDGGYGSAEQKEVTMGEPVGTLPVVQKPNKSFVGWYIGNRHITEEMVWYLAEDATAVARWKSSNGFGDVVDYFGLGSSSLIPVSSEGGEDRQHVVAYNAPSERPACETSVVWLNPTVTYEVVGRTNLSVVIGKGFSGGIGTTGYMIVSVAVRTAIGKPPRVVVSAVANEGADAIKKYAINFVILPRHRPQDVLSSMHLVGYELQELTASASCDPVVVAEGGVPCASDVCHGREVVSAVVADYGDVVSYAAREGWVIIGEPSATDGVGYKTISISARKELS